MENKQIKKNKGENLEIFWCNVRRLSFHTTWRTCETRAGRSCKIGTLCVLGATMAGFQPGAMFVQWMITI